MFDIDYHAFWPPRRVTPVGFELGVDDTLDVTNGFVSTDA